MVPFAAGQPALARQFQVKLTQTPAEFFFVVGVLKRNFTETLSRAKQVDVAIVKTGKNPAAVTLDGRRYYYGPVTGGGHDGGLRLFTLVQRLNEKKSR